MLQRADTQCGAANGAVCKRDSSNNPECEWSDSSPPPPPTDPSPPPPPTDSSPPPPPPTTYDVGTSTDTYTSSSSYSYPIATIETTSAYVTSLRPAPTITPSTNSSSSRSTFSIFNNAETSSSPLSSNQQLSSSTLNAAPGYSVTGIMFLLVISGLI